MSTKSSIVYHEPTDDEPGVHVYEDVLDGMAGDDSIVSVEFEGAINVSFETRARGRITVTVKLPHKTAVAIGLIPAAKATPTALAAKPLPPSASIASNPEPSHDHE